MSFSAGNWEDVGPRLQEAIDLLPQYDSEGYSPIVLSWKARMQIHLHQDRQGAIDLLELAEKRIKPNRKISRGSVYAKYRPWLDSHREY